MSQRHIKNVVVFCGSRAGNLPIFAQEAQTLGRMLAEHGYGLVYGSGKVGLMGEVSQAACEAGGKVIGVNVHMFEGTQGHAPEGIDEESSADMFSRKASMLGKSQASIILFGGLGTLDEAGEVLVENDVMKHHNPDGIIKPVIFINPVIDGEGYWDDLLRQIRKMRRHEFTSNTIGRFFQDVPSAKAAVLLLDRLNAQGPVATSSNHDTVLLPSRTFAAAAMPAPEPVAPVYPAVPQEQPGAPERHI